MKLALGIMLESSIKNQGTRHHSKDQCIPEGECTGGSNSFQNHGRVQMRTKEAIDSLR
jgi:hypothetical protein